MPMPSILKTTLEEKLRNLEEKKRAEYKDIFKQRISKNNVYQSLSTEEQEDLVYKAGVLALSAVSSISWALEKNNNSKSSLKYLKEIKESDGTLEVSRYWNLIEAGIIANDQLTPKLIRILSNDYEIKKRGLSSFSALPDNLDEKPYKDDYIKFCVDSTKKIMEEVLTMVQEEIKEKQPIAKKRQIFLGR